MSISAADWIAKSQVDPAVFERWPDYQVVLLATDHLDITSLAPAADRLLNEATALASGLDAAQPDPHIVRWHQAFRDFGVKPRVARPSVDALIRRASTEAGLPRINPLVDLYNAVSVLHNVPIGGEDLDRYDGAAHLLIAAGAEEFHTTAHGKPVVDHPEPGEPIWVDRGGVTCRRWNWRQTTRTALHDDTRRVGFIIDSLDAPHHDGAHRAAEQLAALLGATHTRTIGPIERSDR